MLKLSDNDLTLRPISYADNALLLHIYASTRVQDTELMQHLGTSHKEVFLQQQFNAQHVYYQNNYKGGNFYVIVKNANPVGRLYLHEQYGDGSVRIIDITILPEWRNKGIGEGLLRDVMKLAQQIGKPVTFHVEKLNRAIYLYKRLGFEIVSEVNSVYYLMKWAG